jgi:glycolate oxidase FAD binding subunit
MNVAAARTERPASYERAASLLAECAQAGARVRVRGGGTKLGWGRVVPEPDVEVSTGALVRVVEHNAGDMTALVQAGVPLARAQEKFAAAGQMLALDPPDDGATVGGVVATGDSGPLRHRYGAPRDVVLGVTAALTSGEVVRAGGKVIKNVAGYDLSKLFAGSFGTLGLITEVAVRLHPLPAATATAIVTSHDPDALAAAAASLSHAALESQSLDVRWSDGEGAVLARFAGSTAANQAADAARLAGGDVVEDDGELWERQRREQRGATVVRVSGVQTQLPSAIAAADAHGATLVGRAALGLWWLSMADADARAIRSLRGRLAPFACVVLDAPDALRAEVDPWDVSEPIVLARRVRERFEPHGVLNPGLFV